MDLYEEFEKTLNDEQFWNLITKEFDEKILLEIEIAKRDKHFNHYNFHEFINYLDKQNNTEK